uniref:40S ribosomal protein S3-3-like n=1 Tax=Fragaria vesca subsp. vesca TaxID=101020 RepID=UPI0005CA7361|nr:PREDICTED: 40S ribosomal protein S3-3-like [Fragaria vesca subsp. vesca]
MKFIDGYMISSGQPVNECIDSAVRHVLLRKGVLGIKVKTMLDWDPDAKPDLLSFLCIIMTVHSVQIQDIRPLENDIQIKARICRVWRLGEQKGSSLLGNMDFS